MSSTVKVLVPAKTLEDAQTTQYTAVGITAMLDKITSLNFSGSPVTVSINLVPPGSTPGNSNLFVKTKTLQAGQSYTYPELTGHNISPGGSISAIASAANAVNIIVSGREVS